MNTEVNQGSKSLFIQGIDRKKNTVIIPSMKLMINNPNVIKFLNNSYYDSSI